MRYGSAAGGSGGGAGAPATGGAPSTALGRRRTLPYGEPAMSGCWRKKAAKPSGAAVSEKTPRGEGSESASGRKDKEGPRDDTNLAPASSTDADGASASAAGVHHEDTAAAVGSFPLEQQAGGSTPAAKK